ncbi:MAG: YdiU family protein [Chromatiales bacterium]|nr:YdiU family protein [Chromatiales bacterium]
MSAFFNRLAFDNRYADLGYGFSTPTDPTPVPSPYRVHFNEQAANLIDLPAGAAEELDFVEFFAGNRVIPGARPVAQVYAGHQFGHFVPELGDGRALLLGQVRNQAGESWDLVLKGGGQTPYSRDGDGRAVLRSTIREYLCSEAMHALGIPTTRALCIIGTDEEVYREEIETGAMLLRMAPSHVRFGHFEFFHHHRRHEAVKRLADHVIDEHFLELATVTGEARYRAWFEEIVRRTARMLAQWQAVGFSHGVMNTDNFSILGLTIDYGPYGFQDAYSHGFVCNHSDHWGRYAFDQQPAVGAWNLQRLGNALSTLLSPESVEAALSVYESEFVQTYVELMRAKLGLLQPRPEDPRLITALLDLLDQYRIDYTLFFRRLSFVFLAPGSEDLRMATMFADSQGFDRWLKVWRNRLLAEGSSDAKRGAVMQAVNPAYVLRNYMAEKAIRKAKEKDYSEIDRLFRLLREPFSEHDNDGDYGGSAPEWASGLAVSCSS